MMHPFKLQNAITGAGKAGLVFGIFLAVGLIFAATGGWLLYGSYQFQRTALTTMAEVISVETVRTRKRDRDGHWKTSITYRPTLRYADQYGTRHVGAPDLRSSTYDFPVASKVEVAFNPDNPGEVRINDFLSTWGFGGFFFLFGLVFATIGWLARRKHRLKAR